MRPLSDRTVAAYLCKGTYATCVERRAARCTAFAAELVELVADAWRARAEVPVSTAALRWWTRAQRQPRA